VHDRLVITDQIANAQIKALRKNCADFGIEFFDVQDASQGIVHMIGPELGAHQARHDHRLRRLAHQHPRSLRSARLRHRHQRSRARHGHADPAAVQAQDLPHNVDGELPTGVTAKDIILDIIGRIGTDGATGYVVEYAGSAIRALSMEGRMTICNMSIEAGARAGMIAPDATTFAYLKGRRFSPKGAAWDLACCSTPSAVRRSHLEPRRRTLVRPRHRPAPPSTASSHRRHQARPLRHLGHLARHGHHHRRHRPHARRRRSEADQKSFARAYEYMDLKPGSPSKTSTVDAVFLGSCTNGRIEDLRAAAEDRRRLPRRHHRPRHGRPRLAAVRSARPKPKASTHLQVRRLRVARARLQHVPRHEPRHPRPASAAPPPATATSKAARAAEAAPTSQPADGRRRRHHRPLHRHPHLEVPLLAPSL
jgi:3-isopropylmalate/(R)-2-methylmalate dehydratase large subunit